MKLSRRTAWVEVASPLQACLARWRASNTPYVDLSCTNPTQLGLLHPPEVYQAIADGEIARYDPQPFGSIDARAAIAAYYTRRGVEVSPERLWLHASTSEAYAHLFTLLCDPGDAVLVPRPGYPLLDVLGDVVGVRRLPYPLVYDGRWHIDMAALRAAVGAHARVRAIVLVAPNNPTGNYIHREELAAIEQLCATHALALVVDEVFADYPLHHDPGRLAHVQPRACPGFVLSGLSKVAALPQMKLSWTVVHGEGAEIAQICARAEHLGDAFLSVSTPVALALPRLLAAAEAIQPAIRHRLTRNLEQLAHLTRSSPVEVLDVEGGWTALLRLPALQGRDDEAWALALLEHAHVLVQPGYLFDLPPPPRVAISLLTPPPDFARAIERIVAFVDASL